MTKKREGLNLTQTTSKNKKKNVNNTSSLGKRTKVDSGGGSSLKKSPKMIIGLTSVFVILGVFIWWFFIKGSSPQTLKEYVLDEYKNNNQVQHIVFTSRSSTEDDIFIEEVDDERYQGVVEFNDNIQYYSYDNGHMIDDEPITDEVTRRVEILSYDTQGLPDFYFDRYYDSEQNLDINMDYFVGEFSSAEVYVLNEDTDLMDVIYYTSADSYEETEADVNTIHVPDLKIEDFDIGGQSFKLFHAVDYLY